MPLDSTVRPPQSAVVSRLRRRSHSTVPRIRTDSRSSDEAAPRTGSRLDLEPDAADRRAPKKGGGVARRTYDQPEQYV